MPILDWDPGQSPEAPGTLTFFEQGSDPSAGFQVSSKGEITAPNATGAIFPSGEFQPADHGMTSWAYDPALCSGGSLAINGSVYLTKQAVRKAYTTSQVWWSITTAGATPVGGQNFVGIYSSAGTLLGSANVDAAISSSGAKSTALSVPLTPGFVWIAFLFNATTAPTLARAGSFETTPNAGLANTSYRFALNGTARTTLAASLTPASNTSVNSLNFWGGLT